MKLLPAILVVVFAFSTVVVGTPSALNPFVEFGNVKEFWSNIKCIYDVVDKVIDESNVDDLWHDVKLQMKAIVEIEWKNCLNITNGVEQEKCKIVVIGHGVHVVTKFVNQLVYDHKLDLDWHKLRIDIATKCFAEHTFAE